jgi:hypothetical protein
MVSVKIGCALPWIATKAQQTVERMGFNEFFIITPYCSGDAVIPIEMAIGVLQLLSKSAGLTDPLLCLTIA